uniref:Uncharacterized protein n=1 Tax=Physcomitrium patens TaxID=3218 RepID=A0A2K1JBG5_PHYPA|nr:hypothetical protein PHYPA_019126 [Physcomitrium patens]
MTQPSWFVHKFAESSLQRGKAERRIHQRSISVRRRQFQPNCEHELADSLPSRSSLPRAQALLRCSTPLTFLCAGKAIFVYLLQFLCAGKAIFVYLLQFVSKILGMLSCVAECSVRRRRGGRGS